MSWEFSPLPPLTDGETAAQGGEVTEPRDSRMSEPRDFRCPTLPGSTGGETKCGPLPLCAWVVLMDYCFSFERQQVYLK